MKILYAAIIFVIVLTLSSVRGLNNEASAWIPEHRCSEKIQIGQCESNKCMKKCFEKSQGRGRCVDNSYCICTFYCHGPPK
ncbi:hypothetical protein ABFS82_11G002700 [Erythranthe guttata]